MMRVPAVADSTRNGRSVIINTCPGCGGDIELIHEFDITRCTHCGSLLRVSKSPELPAYFLRPRVTRYEATARIERSLRSQGLLGRESLSEPESWLIPYWLFAGQLLKRRTSREPIMNRSDSTGEVTLDALPSQQQEREVSLVSLSATVESSLALPSGSPYPQSIPLGQRLIARYPLVGINIYPEWQIATPRGSAPAAIKKCAARIASTGSLFDGDVMKNPTQLFVHESSLLFLPYYKWRDENQGHVTVLVDASTGEIISGQESGELHVDSGDPVLYASELKMELHRCQHCSHDLPHLNSCVYRCENCERFTFRGIDKSKVSVANSINATNSNATWFPFWICKKNGEGNGKIRVVPAFSIKNMEVAFRISRQLTEVIRRVNRNTDIGKVAAPYAASVPVSTCDTFLTAMSARQSLERKLVTSLDIDDYAQELDRVVQVQDWNLLYIPFARFGFEYTDCIVSAVTFPSQVLC